MNLCSDNHEEVCFEGRKCPVCETVSQKDREIEMRDGTISELESKISNLEEQVSELESANADKE